MPGHAGRDKVCTYLCYAVCGADCRCATGLSPNVIAMWRTCRTAASGDRPGTWATAALAVTARACSKARTTVMPNADW